MQGVVQIFAEGCSYLCLLSLLMISWIVGQIIAPLILSKAEKIEALRCILHAACTYKSLKCILKPLLAQSW